MDDEIVVSRQMLKAIGADTRIDILKSLQGRQKTQTELASELKLSAPTISEHLAQLEDSDLVEVNPEYVDKKWKYYRLTKTARNLLERKRSNVILVLANIFAVITCALIGAYFFLPHMFGSPVSSATAMYAPSPDQGASNISPSTATAFVSAPPNYFGIAIVIMITLTAILFAINYLKRKK